MGGFQRYICRGLHKTICTKNEFGCSPHVFKASREAFRLHPDLLGSKWMHHAELSVVYNCIYHRCTTVSMQRYVSSLFRSDKEYINKGWCHIHRCITTWRSQPATHVVYPYPHPPPPPQEFDARKLPAEGAVSLLLQLQICVSYSIPINAKF